MVGERSREELQSLIEAIKASDVVESRVQLLTKLGFLDISEKSDLATLIECLTTFWEDFTCLDVSQCMLNKTILHVAAKYVDSDILGCLLQFLALGTKASIWCGKHLKMTLMSNEESQEEEHCNLFFQLLLNLLSFSAAIFAALTRYPILADKASMLIVEKFVMEQLNLTKYAISETKIISSFSSEVLKAAQVLIDVAIRLCKEYSQAVNWEFSDSRTEKDESSAMNHVLDITKCTIQKFCEFGILAANDGGSLVTILNLSWKGVVSLLQLGNGALAVKVNIEDIIITLISLVHESLRCAARSWSSSLKETVSVTEARRIFVPVKFYLINAVKIASLFPCKAYLVYREIALCVMMISSFRVSMSHEELLKIASEVISELLEKTSFELLGALLNSAEVKQELKLEILDYLFINESYSNPNLGNSNGNYRTNSMDQIFAVSDGAMTGARVLLLGRVALFLSFLRYSFDLEEDVHAGIAMKLGWFLDVLVDEDVYSSILVLQIPVLYGSGKAAELVWQPMFSTSVIALKTFMIVVSSSIAWGELESFLLQNFFHPHFLCSEIVMELWCFMVRFTKIETVHVVMDKLCSLLKFLASSESGLIPSSALRKMAKAICKLLTSGSQSMVDWVYNSIVGDDGSQLSSLICVALLAEGFPLQLLSDKVRRVAKQTITTDYFGFLETFDGKSLRAGSSTVLGVPVFALSASLQSHQVSISDIDMKTLKFIVTVIRNYRSSLDKVTKDHYLKLLSETLQIISYIKHLYASDGMEEVILELQNMFISGPAASDIELYQCKPNLALFMAGLSDMEMVESDECAKSIAVWELYHLLLKERHWAFAHLAIAAFGHFAARTNCNQLWRFVPKNASLSYDLASGNEANEERFMTELKVFLEKEMALPTITRSDEQLGLLVVEGSLLKQMISRVTNVGIEDIEGERMEIDGENQSNKRRKLPDSISQGMELLQSGMKVIGDGLSSWENQVDSAELHDKFLIHFSRLKDVITNLVGLNGNG